MTESWHDSFAERLDDTYAGLDNAQIDADGNPECGDEYCPGLADCPACRALRDADRQRYESTDGSDRERLLRENPELIEQIQEGIAEAEAGRTVYLGSFAQYLDDETGDA